MDETSLQQALRGLREPELLPDPTLAAQLRRRHDRRRHAVPVVVAGLGVAVAAAAVPLLSGQNNGPGRAGLASEPTDVSPTPTAPPTLPPAPEPAVPADDLTRSLPSLPSDELTDRQLGRDISFTITTLQDRCLVAAGLPKQKRAPSLDDVMAPRGSTSLSSAEADGYGSRQWIGDPDETPPPESLTAAQARVLNGTDPEVGGSRDSCSGSITRRIYGTDTPHDVDLLNALGGALSSQVSADPRMAAATRAWSACMGTRGLRYATPSSALNAVGDSYAPGSTPVPFSEERRIAVADVTCKQQTDLLGVERTVRIELERRFFTIYAQELAEVRTELAHARRVTAEVIAEELGD